MADDGRVIIKLTSNATEITEEFERLTASENKLRAALNNLIKVGDVASRKSNLEDKIIRETQAADSAFKAFQRLSNVKVSGADFKSLEQATQSATQRLKELALAGRTNDTEFRNLAVQVRANNKAMDDAKNAVSKATGAFDGLSSQLRGLKGIAAGLGIYAGTQQIVEFGNEASKTSLKMDGVVNAFNAGAYGFLDGANQLKFAREEAEKYGLALEGVIDPYSKFMTAFIRSGGQFESSKQIFDDISTAVVSLHLSTQQTESIYRALEQMANKGTVQMEELKRQLGNSLPGAFELAAKAMGISTSKLSEMMSEGKVFSADFLPKFASVVKEELGGSADAASKQANACFNRYRNDLFELGDAAGDSLNLIKMDFLNNTRGIVQGTTQSIRAIQDMSSTLVPLTQAVLVATATFISFKVAAGVQLTGALSAASWAFAALKAPIISATLALDVLKASLVANPLLWAGATIAVGIGAVTYSLQKNHAELKKTAKESIQLAESVKNNAAEVPKLVAEYHTLSSATKRTGEQDQRLLELKDMLNTQYPELLANFDKELNSHNAISGSIANQIVNTIKLAEANRVLAQSKEINDKYDKTISNKWFWNENSYAATINKIKAMEEYTNATDATTASLRKLIDVENRKTSAKIIQEETTKTSGWSNPVSSKEKKAKKEKRPDDAIELLNKQLQEYQHELNNLAGAGEVGSEAFNKIKLSAEKTSEKIKLLQQQTRLSTTPFADLQHNIQLAQQKLNDFAATGDMVNVQRTRNELVKLTKEFEQVQRKAHVETTPWGELNYKLQEQRRVLTNLTTDWILYGKGSKDAVDAQKNLVAETQNQIDKINTKMESLQGLSFKNISSSLSNDLSNAITTPLQEGESAFKRLGDVAFNTIQKISAELIRVLLITPTIDKIAEAFRGLKSDTAGTITGAAAPIKSIAVDAVTGATGIGAMATSMQIASPIMNAAAPAMATAGAAMSAAAIPASTYAAALTQAAIAQAALSVANIPIAGAVLAPLAATATGAAIGLGNTLAAAGMSVSKIAGKFAKGGAFDNGRVIPFARGGVVSSPTIFPMANNQVGLMGEKAGTPESIMPLKRMANGDLGVQAQSAQPSVNVFNYTNSKVETIRRPNNDIEIKIREYDAYLNSDRSNDAFQNASSRNANKGYNAA